MAKDRLSGVPWVWALVAILVFVVVVWLVFALLDGRDSPTVFDIMNDPDEWFGETVALGGEVNEILSEEAFTMGLEATDDAGILVIMRGEAATQDGPGQRAFQDDDIVFVTGEVRQFDTEELADEGLAVETELTGNFESQPVIVADEVDLTHRPD